MRFSSTYLTCKYLNRETRFGGALAFSFFATLATCASLPLLLYDLPLFLQGKSTSAVVREKFIAQRGQPRWVTAQLLAHGGGRRRGPRPQVRFEFTVAGKVFSGVGGVSGPFFEQVVPGDTVQVIYLPSDPQIYRLGSRWPLLAFWPALLLATLFWALAFWMLRAGVRNVAWQVQLVTNGTATLAIIDEFELSTLRRGRQYVRGLKYTYLVNTYGQKHLEHVEESYDVPFAIGEVSPGDVLLVLYDPLQPKEHTIDRFDARRDDRLRLQGNLERELRNYRPGDVPAKS